MSMVYITVSHNSRISYTKWIYLEIIKQIAQSYQIDTPLEMIREIAQLLHMRTHVITCEHIIALALYTLCVVYIGLVYAPHG